LSELLRAGLVSPVYHGNNGGRTLKELARSYLTITKDQTRVMNRLKAMSRSWGIPCAGRAVYGPVQRKEWLDRLPEAGIRRRGDRLYEQFDHLRSLRQEARKELIVESWKHSACPLLRQIPWLVPIRVALILALMQTPDRFRTKRQLWAYRDLVIETRVSGEYRYTNGELQRSGRRFIPRGLNDNHNHDLKNVFNGAATRATASAGPFQDFYTSLIAKSMRPSMARLTLARKIAAITLAIWKKGDRFDGNQLKSQNSVKVR
jgi:hypothetical protein